MSQFKRDQYLEKCKEALLSKRLRSGNLAKDILNKQAVYLCVHGFGASPFEWSEFQEDAESNGQLVSSVLLGKHQNLNSFKQSTWQDWADPILDEYHQLLELGATSIIICSASTASALVLQAYHQGLFKNRSTIKAIACVAPLLFFQDKRIYFLPYIHPIISDQPVRLNKDESAYWLPKQPVSCLRELLSLTKCFKSSLDTGLNVHKQCKLALFHSDKDPVVPAKSATYIYRSLKDKMLNASLHISTSNLHVATRLKGRLDLTDSDYELQKKIFKEILNLAL